jgi:LUC7 N_terminus
MVENCGGYQHGGDRRCRYTAKTSRKLHLQGTSNELPSPFTSLQKLHNHGGGTTQAPWYVSIPIRAEKTLLIRTPEQLMGEQLMSAQGTRAPQLAITDPKVCRSYLIGTCPHDLFTNTKQDFGPCPKVHNEGLKAEYEAADAEQRRKWSFEFDYLRDMQKYVDECNRRIDGAQRRLEKTPDEIRQTNLLVGPLLPQTPFTALTLEYNSLSKLAISPKPYLMAYSKSPSSARKAPSTWRLPNFSK